MSAPQLLVAFLGVVAATLVALFARGLLSPRQFAVALGGVTCGAAIGAAWAGGGHD